MSFHRTLYFTYTMSSAFKNIITKLNKGEKLNGNNCKIWSMKIQYTLKEQKALDALNIILDEPKTINIAQHRWDRKAYDA